MENVTCIQRAVDLHGGSPSKFASALGGGVLRQHVEHWIKSGRVSAEKCPDVEALTGIKCEELRPDVNWAVLRKQPRKQRQAQGVA